jgi:hypothetical protein
MAVRKKSFGCSCIEEVTGLSSGFGYLIVERRCCIYILLLGSKKEFNC